MKRIHYLLIILATMLMYAVKIWVIPLLPETITIDNKITIKKPMFYVNMFHEKKYTLSGADSSAIILLHSFTSRPNIYYSFDKEEGEGFFVLARISTGRKEIKKDTCYLQEDQLKYKGQTFRQSYIMHAYPYTVSFIESDYDRMADLMRQVCKDENGRDRKIILLEPKTIGDPPLSNSNPATK